jgi:hypothetical protein
MPSPGCVSGAIAAHATYRFASQDELANRAVNPAKTGQ